MRTKVLTVSFFLLTTLFVSSCQESPTKRTYKEIVRTPAMSGSKMPMDDIHRGLMDRQRSDVELPSTANVPLNWTAPKGWKEKKGSGLRMATFTAKGVECSIVSLGGMAGGLRSNVVRWLRQINVVLTDQELTKFLKTQKKLVTAGGLKATVIDFTQLQEDRNDATPSMMTTLIEVDGAVVFVKMTGQKKALLSNKEKFMKLSESLRLKE